MKKTIPLTASCGCEMHAEPRKAVAVDTAIKASNLRRLRLIEGQVRGLQKMVEEDRYCADIMVQISSVQQALRGVGRALMRNHLKHCATKAIRTGEVEANVMYDELEPGPSAPSSSGFEASQITFTASKAHVLPTPLHVSHAPYGLLKEKERGSSCGMLVPSFGKVQIVVDQPGQGPVDPQVHDEH